MINVFIKLIMQNSSLSTSFEIALRWMPQNFARKKSTLVQIMTWCCQATRHYRSKCWPRFMPLGHSELIYKYFPTYISHIYRVQLTSQNKLQHQNPMNTICDWMEFNFVPLWWKMLWYISCLAVVLHMKIIIHFKWFDGITLEWCDIGFPLDYI